MWVYVGYIIYEVSVIRLQVYYYRIPLRISTIIITYINLNNKIVNNRTVEFFGILL